MSKANDTHSIAVLNSHAEQINGHSRFMGVIGDSMAPTLSFNHLAAVVPMSGYAGEGLYVLEVLGQPDYVRCQSMGRSGVLLTRDNPRYASTGQMMAWPEFEAALLGKVAAICNVVEPTLFGRA